MSNVSRVLVPLQEYLAHRSKLSQSYAMQEKAFSPGKREKLADAGKAQDDGSYPIENVADLKNAIAAFGRSKDPEATKRHIIERAKALGATKLLPENWNVKVSEAEVEPDDLAPGTLLDPEALEPGDEVTFVLTSEAEVTGWVMPATDAEHWSVYLPVGREISLDRAKIAEVRVPRPLSDRLAEAYAPVTEASADDEKSHFYGTWKGGAGGGAAKKAIRSAKATATQKKQRLDTHNAWRAKLAKLRPGQSVTVTLNDPGSTKVSGEVASVEHWRYTGKAQKGQPAATTTLTVKVPKGTGDAGSDTVQIEPSAIKAISVREARSDDDHFYGAYGGSRGGAGGSMAKKAIASSKATATRKIGMTRGAARLKKLGDRMGEDIRKHGGVGGPEATFKRMDAADRAKGKAPERLTAQIKTHAERAKKLRAQATAALNKGNAEAQRHYDARQQMLNKADEVQIAAISKLRDSAVGMTPEAMRAELSKISATRAKAVVQADKALERSNAASKKGMDAYRALLDRANNVEMQMFSVARGVKEARSEDDHFYGAYGGARGGAGGAAQRAISASKGAATRKLATKASPSRGAFALDKTSKVTFHEPAAAAFAKEYAKAMKGDYRAGGPTPADEKASDNFWMNYDSKTISSGFAGSGVSLFTNTMTGASYRVQRSSNGKTFYGTDHTVFAETPPYNTDPRWQRAQAELNDIVRRSPYLSASSSQMLAESRNPDDDHPYGAVKGSGGRGGGGSSDAKKAVSSAKATATRKLTGQAREKRSSA